MARHARATQRRRRWYFDLRGLGLLLLAVVLAGLGYSEIEDQHILRHRGVVVTATVIDEYHAWKGSDTITVRFVTTGGQVVEEKTSRYFDAEVGGTIPVIYDPRDPTRLQAVDWGLDYWTPAVLWGAATLVFLGAAVFRFWRAL